MAASGSVVSAAAGTGAGAAAGAQRAATVALTRAVSAATVAARESTAALPVGRGLAGAGSGAAGQWPASSESSRAVKAVTVRRSESTVAVGAPCAAAMDAAPPRRATIKTAVRSDSRIGLLYSCLGEPVDVAPDVEFRGNGRGSGGWGAGMLQATGVGVARGGGRGCLDPEHERRRDAERLGAPQRFLLGRDRLGEGAAVGVVGAARRLDVRDVGERVVAGHVEQRAVRQREPQAPRAGRARRGARSGGGRRGWSRVEYSPSARGPRPSWRLRPRG